MALRLTRSVAGVQARQSRSLVVPACTRTTVVTRASLKTQEPSRRETLGAAATLLFANIVAVAPAHAFLGFGEDDNQVQAVYADETAAMLTKVKNVLALDRDDPTKEDAVKALRKDINSWVAKYRREPKVSGRPSFGAMYSAMNTLAGHYNSFGFQAPLPKKRLEGLNKELDDAATFLARNR